MSIFTKSKWLLFYYTKHPKGKFELRHILELIITLLIFISLSEVVLYICLNA